MKKILVVIPIIIGVILGIGLIPTEKSEDKVEYHITLADPKLYNNGVFVDSFEIKKGNYQFSFVPNGDSPTTLSIILKGDSFLFSEDFELQGTLHDTGISEYYTWDYHGVKEIQIPKDSLLEITIDPNGNLVGPVSVDLKK